MKNGNFHQLLHRVEQPSNEKHGHCKSSVSIGAQCTLRTNGIATKLPALLFAMDVFQLIDLLVEPRLGCPVIRFNSLPNICQYDRICKALA